MASRLGDPRTGVTVQVIGQAEHPGVLNDIHPLAMPSARSRGSRHCRRTCKRRTGGDGAETFFLAITALDPSHHKRSAKVVLDSHTGCCHLYRNLVDSVGSRLLTEGVPNPTKKLLL